MTQLPIIYILLLQLFPNPTDPLTISINLRIPKTSSTYKRLNGFQSELIAKSQSPFFQSTQCPFISLPLFHITNILPPLDTSPSSPLLNLVKLNLAPYCSLQSQSIKFKGLSVNDYAFPTKLFFDVELTPLLSTKLLKSNSILEKIFPKSTVTNHLERHCNYVGFDENDEDKVVRENRPRVLLFEMADTKSFGGTALDGADGISPLVWYEYRSSKLTDFSDDELDRRGDDVEPCTEFDLVDESNGEILNRLTVSLVNTTTPRERQEALQRDFDVERAEKLALDVPASDAIPSKPSCVGVWAIGGTSGGDSNFILRSDGTVAGGPILDSEDQHKGVDGKWRVFDAKNKISKKVEKRLRIEMKVPPAREKMVILEGGVKEGLDEFGPGELWMEFKGRKKKLGIVGMKKVELRGVVEFVKTVKPEGYL